MPTDLINGTAIELSPAEVELLRDAITFLATKPERRRACFRFALEHEELGLLHHEPLPVPEEDR